MVYKTNQPAQPVRSKPASNASAPLRGIACAAAVAALLIACGDDPGERQSGGFASGQYQLCEEGSFPLVDHLQPREPVDSISLRVRGEEESWHELSGFGTPCANATDEAKCQTQLQAVEGTFPYETTSCNQLCYQLYLVTTSRGEVRAWPGAVGLTSFLGAVDTPSEAILAAFYAKYDPSCAAADETFVHKVGDAYEFLAIRPGSECPGPLTAVTLRVVASGQVTAREPKQLASPPEPWPCP